MQKSFRVSDEVLGKGGFATVYKAKDGATKGDLAVKVIQLDHNTTAKEVKQEFDMLKAMQHRNIVQVVGELFIDKNEAFIFMEYLPRSIEDDPDFRSFRWHESTIIDKVRDALNGLHCLHTNNLAHGDIKLANMMLTSKGHVKLSDFGTCAHVGTGASNKFVGTLVYASPEAILHYERGKPNDVWCLGASIVHMAGGKHMHPWNEQKGLLNHPAGLFVAIAQFMSENMEKFERDKIPFHPCIPSHLSEVAKDFLMLCFVSDKSLRATCETLLKHPFLQKYVPILSMGNYDVFLAKQSDACASPQVNVETNAEWSTLTWSLTASLTNSQVAPRRVIDFHQYYEQIFSKDVTARKDPGQPDYFRFMAPSDEHISISVARADFTGYSFCTVVVKGKMCNVGMMNDHAMDHMEACHEGVDDRSPMTLEWVMQQVADVDDGKKAMHIYMLDTPLRREANKAMRQVTGDNRSPFQNPTEAEKPFVERYCYFMKMLVSELQPLPDEKATTYRALQEKVPESLYFPGAVVTWNQPSCTALNVETVNNFLDTDGTLFIIQVRTGKKIRDNEIILLPNTQLRVLPPITKGMKDLLASILKRDLTKVAVIELQEVQLHYYSDLYKDGSSVFTEDEEHRVSAPMKRVRDLDFSQGQYSTVVGVRNAVTGATDRRKLRLLSMLPYPEFLQEILDCDIRPGTWAVFLHRLNAETILESTYSEDVGRVFLKVLRMTRLQIETSEYARVAMTPYATLPSAVYVAGLMLDKIGLQRVQKALGDHQDFHDDLLHTLAATARIADLQQYLQQYLPFARPKSIGSALFYCAMSKSNVSAEVALLLLVHIGDCSVAPCDVNGYTPLHIAALKGDDALVMALVAKYPMWIHSVTRKSLQTPLHLACQGGSYLSAFHMIAAYKEGMYVMNNVLNAVTNTGTSSLMFAVEGCHEALIKMLVTECPDLLLMCDREGRSPLYRAATNGYLSLVKYFVTENRETTKLFRTGNKSALYIACELGHLDIVKYLEKEAPHLLTVMTTDHKSCIDIASANEKSNDVHDWFLRTTSRNDSSPTPTSPSLECISPEAKAGKR